MYGKSKDLIQSLATCHKKQTEKNVPKTFGSLTLTDFLKHHEKKLWPMLILLLGESQPVVDGIDYLNIRHDKYRVIEILLIYSYKFSLNGEWLDFVFISPFIIKKTSTFH